VMVEDSGIEPLAS